MEIVGAAAASVAASALTAKHNKLKLREVNRHLVCRLCRGYYVDATTIAECLHSFCRSCIIKYLEKNSFCPICEVQIHKTKPYLNLRLDKALQDVVYKLVPGLYHNEMRRRREFYSKNPGQTPIAASEACGLEERIIFSPEDSISLSLEYLESDVLEKEAVSNKMSEPGDYGQDGRNLSFPQQLGLMKLKNPYCNNDGKNSRRESQDAQEKSSYPKRYLQCPAVVSVFHLKKFIRMKHELSERAQVDIIHKRVPLPDNYTLMDVAYIYTWKRSAPMRFFYQIFKTKRHKVKVPIVPPPEDSSIPQNPKETSKETAKVTKNATGGHQTKGGTVKPAVESNKNAKVDVKSDLISREKQTTSEVKPSPIAETVTATPTTAPVVIPATTATTPTTVTAGTTATTATMTEKPAFKTVINNKAMLESKKLESARKLERIVNGIKRDEKRLEAEMEKKKAEASKVSKSDKSNSGAVNVVDSPQDKVNSGKTETAEGSEIKSGEEVTVKSNERLLLNPVSGQLELVPLEETKPMRTTGTMTTKTGPGAVPNSRPLVIANGKKDIVEPEKRRLTEEGPKSPETKGLSIEKRSFVNSLKTFRKERPSAGTTEAAKEETKKNKGNVLTITPIPKSSEVPQEKETEKPKKKQGVEITKEKSEYDFDGEASPPNKITSLQKPSSKEDGVPKDPKNSWMSLQDFRMKRCKENGAPSEETEKKDRRKSVPSLYRINTDASKKLDRKTPNGNVTSDKTGVKKSPPIVLNTEKDEAGGKTETKPNAKAPSNEKILAPPPIMIENRGGEYSIKQREEPNPKKSNKSDGKSGGEPSNRQEEKTSSDGKTQQELVKDLLKKGNDDPGESEVPKKKSKPNVEEVQNDQVGAMDLSKSETSPKSLKNPLENLIDLANKTGSGKSDENMVEALISVAQKQSIEPLLKIPHYSQNLKACQDSPPLSKNISSHDISQALQFFKDLRSDIKNLEARSQLSPNSFLEQLSQKTTNLEPIQLYQQHIDLIRRLKRQQQHLMIKDKYVPDRKLPRLSPPNLESKKKGSSKGKVSSSNDTAQLKSSVERTLCQIQEQMEIQSRMVVAQNYKNLIQYYGGRPQGFGPSQSSPPKSSQNKHKPSSHSPNSQKSPDSRKSPHNLTPPSGSLSMGMGSSDGTFFNNQYGHLINAGLNSEMTFHQMFQNYLMQQEKINKIRQNPGMGGKKGSGGGGPPPKPYPDLYYGAQSGAKKPEPSPVPTAQKT